MLAIPISLYWKHLGVIILNSLFEEGERSQTRLEIHSRTSRAPLPEQNGVRYEISWYIYEKAPKFLPCLSSLSKLSQCPDAIAISSGPGRIGWTRCTGASWPSTAIEWWSCERRELAWCTSPFTLGLDWTDIWFGGPPPDHLLLMLLALDWLFPAISVKWQCIYSHSWLQLTQWRTGN